MSLDRRHVIGAADDVELIVTGPAPTRARGALLFVHGFQGGSWLGAREFADSGALRRFSVEFDIIAAALSQPGFGASAGPPDFCGPRTQAAIDDALTFLRDALADDRPVVLYGRSRGAAATAMVATRDEDLAGLILSSGSYDLAATYKAAPTGLRRTIQQEAGIAEADIAVRSPLRHAYLILADTLLLHGRQDDRAPFAQAERMASALRRSGAAATLEAFDCGHSLPLALSREAIRRFLAGKFGGSN